MHKVTVGGKKATAQIQPAMYPGLGSGHQLRQHQRIWEILVVPGSGRGGGPQLAVTQIDSGLARELECMESQALALSSRGTQRDFFQQGN